MRAITKILLIYILLVFNVAKADGHKTNENWSFYTGMFDFSDEGKKSNLFGIQHINTGKDKNSFLGVLQPVTGLMITGDNAAYIYTGVEWNYDVGNKMMFTPSFAPGLYAKGEGKDLGHVLEFKTEIQLSYKLSDKSNFGMSYNHVSNASLGDKNPGENSYMLNFLKKF